MRKTHIRLLLDRKWLMPLAITFTFSIIYFSTLSLNDSSSSDESESIDLDSISNAATDFRFGLLPNLPRFAYLISGTKGDSFCLKRLLRAVYHPRNYYLLHLDLDASDVERVELAKFVKSDSVLRHFRNVMVVGKADLITYRGPTMIASTLHMIAILLKRAKDWDWFINLSATDYPLMSQDDLLHIFSYLPRDLNFLEHTSDIGWKENQRARPLIVDPGLYHSKKSGVFYAKEKRSMPASFKLFMGYLLTHRGLMNQECNVVQYGYRWKLGIY